VLTKHANNQMNDVPEHMMQSSHGICHAKGEGEVRIVFVGNRENSHVVLCDRTQKEDHTSNKKLAVRYMDFVEVGGFHHPASLPRLVSGYLIVVIVVGG